MEYVEGTTVSDWLKEEPRSWREVLAIFRQAGQGLAAAHAAQLVHRDFKPGNVLLGKDGRVQVMDFGLARLSVPGEEAETRETPVPLVSEAPGAILRLYEQITLTGVVMGTPQYMAPEQYRGDTPDARSDQFSFCAALYYALYGQRPFKPLKMVEALKQSRPRAPGGEQQTLTLPPPTARSGKGFWGRSGEVEEKEEPVILEPPREPRVPSWLRLAVMRGLSLAPEKRFASMEELLTHLSGPRPAVRRLWAVAVASVILLVYPLIWYGLVAKPDLCTDTELALVGAWDGDTQGRVEAAFTASGRPYAASTWETVKQTLDGYSGRWVRMQTQVCQAAQQGSQQADSGLAARQGCLEQRRVRLEALTQVLAQADGRMVDRALDAVGALPNLERCADVESLPWTVRPPETPDALAQVRSLQGRLARVQALGSAGQHPEALALAEPILKEARALDYPPLLATALFEVASCRAKTGDTKTPVPLMIEAWWAAERGRDDALRVELASQLAFFVGYTEANAQAGQQWGQHAQAVLDRLGGDDALQADLLMRLGAVAAREGRFTEVKELNERALALNDRARGPHHPKRTSILTNLGNAYTDLGQRQRGRELLEEALSLHERLLGVGHPGGLIIRMNLASVLNYLKDFQGAQRHLEVVLAQAPGTYGQEHIIVGGAHEGLAFSLYEQGRYDEALEQGAKALAVLEKAGGPKHPDLAHVLCDLGRVHLKQRRADTALKYLERALALGNPSRSLAGSIRFSLAQALREQGQGLERARALAKQAQEDFLASNQQDEATEVERFQARLSSEPRLSKRGARQR